MRSLPCVTTPDTQVGSRKSTWKYGWGSPGRGLQPGSITGLQKRDNNTQFWSLESLFSNDHLNRYPSINLPRFPSSDDLLVVRLATGQYTNIWSYPFICVRRGLKISHCPLLLGGDRKLTDTRSYLHVAIVTPLLAIDQIGISKTDVLKVNNWPENYNWCTPYIKCQQHQETISKGECHHLHVGDDV